MNRRDARAGQFDQLYRETFQSVYAYCLRRLDRRDDVDDIVSDVFATVWRRFDDALAADSQLAWIYGIAYRVVGNHRRGRARAGRLAQRLRTLPQSAGDADPSDALENLERLAAAQRALDAVPPLEQELLRLAIWEELSHAEIAEVLGIDASLVRSRLYRARRRFQHELNDLVARDELPMPDTKERNGGSTPVHRRSDGGRTEGTSA